MPQKTPVLGKKLNGQTGGNRQKTLEKGSQKSPQAPTPRPKRKRSAKSNQLKEREQQRKTLKWGKTVGRPPER